MRDLIEERLAAAQLARREKAVVSHRLDEARADRERLARELGRANRVVTKEQADVQGFGFWGRLAATRAELAKEHGELVASVLERDAIAEELRAAEIYVRELEARAAAVGNADIEYEIAVAEKEQYIRLDPGPLAAKLAAIDASERDARMARRQIAEALGAGRAVRRSLAGALDVIDGAQLGAAHHLLVLYQRECKDVIGCSLTMPVTPMRAVEHLNARDLAWNALPPLTELVRIIDDTMVLLRERDAQLERGLGRLVRERATAIDS